MTDKPTTVDAAEAMVFEIARDIAQMRGKVASVKAKRLSGGEYADPVWFARINARIAQKGIEHQEMIALAATLRRKARNVIEHHFLNAAREHLAAELFEFLMAQAENRFSAGSQQ